MEVLCKLFVRPGITAQGRFHLIRMMFGGHVDEYDYHYTGFYFDFLNKVLAEAGFKKAQKMPFFGIFKDASTLCLDTIPISLNIIAFKSDDTLHNT